MVGVVAALVSAIVVVAGAAATVFLMSNGAFLRAAAAGGLTAVCALAIAALVPRTAVTLHSGSEPLLHIRQTSLFPTARHAIVDLDGGVLATLRRPAITRFGRERWRIERESLLIAEAVEPSAWLFLVRTPLALFTDRWRADLRIVSGGIECAALWTRGPRASTLDITSDLLDPRIAVGLAVLVLGGARRSRL